MRFLYLVFHSIDLLILLGDAEQNPEPKDEKYFSLCHLKLNSLAAHNFADVNAIKDTHREKAPSNKTSVLTKSMNMGIFVAVTSN